MLWIDGICIMCTSRRNVTQRLRSQLLNIKDSDFLSQEWAKSNFKKETHVYMTTADVAIAVNLASISLQPKKSSIIIPLACLTLLFLFIQGRKKNVKEQVFHYGYHHTCTCTQDESGLCKTKLLTLFCYFLHPNQVVTQ